MESEQQIFKAEGRIHRLLQRHGKKHDRIHMNAAEDNVDRLRALKGICGSCTSLSLVFHHQDGKDLVNLQCQKGFSPLDLYRNILPGQTPSCPGFEKK